MSPSGSGLFALLPPGVPFLAALALVTAVALAVHAVQVRRMGAERLDRWNARIEQIVVAALLCGMLVLSGVQVVLRNFFHGGLLWIDPLVRTLLLWIAIAGALAATGRARHIRIDVLGRLLNERPRRALTRALSVLASICCAALADGAYEFLMGEYYHGVSPFLGVPSWVTQSILLIGFGGLAYRFLVQAIWPSPPQEIA